MNTYVFCLLMIATIQQPSNIVPSRYMGTSRQTYGVYQNNATYPRSLRVSDAYKLAPLTTIDRMPVTISSVPNANENPINFAPKLI